MVATYTIVMPRPNEYPAQVITVHMPMLPLSLIVNIVIRQYSPTLTLDKDVLKNMRQIERLRHVNHPISIHGLVENGVLFLVTRLTPITSTHMLALVVAV
jgi:hypothetical protein